MSRLTHAQKLAFAREIAEVLNNNKAGLVTAGYDPTQKIEELGAESKIAEKDDADQQQVLAASRQATITANTSMDKVYNNASASVDVIAGLIGKTNPITHELRKIRGKMNR